LHVAPGANPLGFAPKSFAEKSVADQQDSGIDIINAPA